MSMNFLNGMQIRQFLKGLVKGLRFSHRLFVKIGRPEAGLRPGDGEAG